MAKKKAKTVDVATMQPDELNELKKLVGEFMRRLSSLENEMESLKEARKELIEEFAEKLDMKTLTTAIKAVKLEASVAHKHTFDVFVEVLKDDVTNGLVDG